MHMSQLGWQERISRKSASRAVAWQHRSPSAFDARRSTGQVTTVHCGLTHIANEATITPCIRLFVFRKHMERLNGGER